MISQDAIIHDLGRELESNFNFHSPDYLMKLDPALIPADAEVMVVRFVHPYSPFDPITLYGNRRKQLALHALQLDRQNDDGKLWVDDNGNGAVNHADLHRGSTMMASIKWTMLNSEIQQGEYVRMDYEFGGIGRTHLRPRSAQAHGRWLLLRLAAPQQRSYSATQPSRLASSSTNAPTGLGSAWHTIAYCPANSTATFDAVADIPADA